MLPVDIPVSKLFPCCCEGEFVNIGQAAKLSGVSAKMLRHYEATGLMPKVVRTQAGYRHYTEHDIYTLRFIRRARAAGFGSSQIRRLLSLWYDRQRPAREVKQLASEHLVELQTRIMELQAMAAALSQLMAHCQGDDRPHCPILETLAGTDSIAERDFVHDVLVSEEWKTQKF